MVAANGQEVFSALIWQQQTPPREEHTKEEPSKQLTDAEYESLFLQSNQTITAEYVGLVNAFLYQGVTDVVSTLWTVTDDASSFSMIYFYWQIKKGKSPAVALNKATKWLRNLTFALTLTAIVPR